MIRPAQLSDLDAIAQMRALLWPDGSVEEHRRELETTLRTGRNGTLPMITFVAEVDGSPAGFLDVGLRSHADGCNPARPVGFIEGWFVAESFRGRGIGRELMQAAEDWSRAQGCKELASDTWIDHTDSQRAHEALGFEVVDRCVNYRKAL